MSIVRNFSFIFTFTIFSLGISVPAFSAAPGTADKKGAEKMQPSAQIAKPSLKAPSPPCTTVNFSKLHQTITTEMLYSMSSPYGEVKQANVFMDNSTGRSKGIGRATFAISDSGHAAVRGLNGFPVHGKNIAAKCN